MVNFYPWANCPAECPVSPKSVSIEKYKSQRLVCHKVGINPIHRIFFCTLPSWRNLQNDNPDERTDWQLAVACRGVFIRGEYGSSFWCSSHWLLRSRTNYQAIKLINYQFIKQIFWWRIRKSGQKHTTSSFVDPSGWEHIQRTYLFPRNYRKMCYRGDLTLRYRNWKLSDLYH